MVLAMTHEEVVADLVRNEIRSYRQLPAPDLPHPDQMARRPAPARRADPGPRVHHAGQLQPGRQLGGSRRAVPARITRPTSTSFDRCGLPVVAVRADTGMMGGKAGPRVHVPDPYRRGYPLLLRPLRLLRQPPGRPRPKAVPRPSRSRRCEKSPPRTPRSIEALAAFLSVPNSAHRQSGLSHGRVPEPAGSVKVSAVVRGDMEVNETKLANAVGARDLRPALEDEIRAVGAVPGYASPVGLKDLRMVVDELVPSAPTWSPGRTKKATTCSTSTTAAITPPTIVDRHRRG